MKISVMDKKDSAIAISFAKFKELKDNLLITELDDVMRLCEEALAQPAQEPVTLLNKMQSITEQEYYEAQLRADNERLREALESMTDMCLTQIGADYNIEIHNRYEKAKQALSATPAQSTKGDV